MKKAELILANFDARIPNIEIKPQNTDSKVVFSSKMYDEDDEHDMLNCFDVLGDFSKNIDDYAAFVQNVEGGEYIIIAKQVRVER